MRTVRNSPTKRWKQRKPVGNVSRKTQAFRPFSEVRGYSAGFTLIELIAATGIVVILIALAVGAYRGNLHRFEAARCMGNLRNLHVALSSHIQDQKQWPQLPENLLKINSPQEYQWWIQKLEPYGMEKRSWICPTLSRLVREKKTSGQAPEIHYLPTPFDEHAMTPFKWPDMPWAAEVADIHGLGVLRLYSDGSVRPFKAFRDQAELPTVKSVP